MILSTEARLTGLTTVLSGLLPLRSAQVSTGVPPKSFLLARGPLPGPVGSPLGVGSAGAPGGSWSLSLSSRQNP